MPLTLRTLTNAGDPLCTADGQVLSGVRVSFQLVDSYGVATTSWDALTHEAVVGQPIVATTDEDGEFSVDLWPNSRGNPPTRYRCTVDHPAFKTFSGTVDDLSLGPLQWVEFMAASATLEPQDLGEMSLYRQEFAAGLQTLGTAVGVAGASATASQGSASAAAAAQSAAAASAATASTQAGAAADAAGQSASSASTASTQAGVASTQAGQAATSATLAQQWATRTDAEVVAGQGYGAMKYALDAAGSASAASNAASAAAATVSGLQTALSGKVDASDPRLSDAREWTAGTVDQAEAEAGTATTRKAWTAQRVRQAMLGWWGGFAAKATPVDADSIVIADSAASNAPKRLTWANAVEKLRGTFVEGPASAVDGQVMVFDGATGKKAKSGGVLGSAAFVKTASMPWANMLKDSGRFDGGTSSVIAAGSTFNSGGLFSKYRATQLASAGKFIHNNSDFGGPQGPLPQTVKDLLTAMGRTANSLRYGIEFYILEITNGSTATADRGFEGEDFWIQTTNGYQPIFGVDKYCTVSFWARAIDQDALFDVYDGYYNGAPSPVSKRLPVSAGWAHIQSSHATDVGYLSVVPSVWGKPGGKIQIAIPVLLFGRLFEPVIQKAPVPFVGIGI